MTRRASASAHKMPLIDEPPDGALKTAAPGTCLIR
jgi:hypothetical protein